MIFPLNYVGITSPYGTRTVTINGKVDTNFHYGIDLGWNTSKTNPIYSSADGVVVNCGTASDGAIFCIIKHEQLRTLTRYWHLSKLTVAKGQVVKQYEQIGNMGMSGYADAPHLHFETWINLPANYIYSANDRNKYAVNPLTCTYVRKGQTISPKEKNVLLKEEESIEVINAQLKIELKQKEDIIEKLSSQLLVIKDEKLILDEEIASLKRTITNQEGEIAYLNNQLGTITFRYTASKDGYFRVKLYKGETFYIKG